MSVALEVEPSGFKDFGSCPCCGRSTRRVWGLVNREKSTLASYFVEWTLGHMADRGANFDFIIGKWGADTSASDRFSASLSYRILESGPSFMIIDSDVRPIARSTLVGRALKRIDAIDNPVSVEIFAIADAVFVGDERISELHTGVIDSFH